LICAAVLARDEERFIGGCLESLRWADELLVLVDGRTRDGTASLAECFTDRVETLAWRGFGGQRNAALERARGDWVLFVDADERVPPPLADEVRRTVADQVDAVGYWIPRRNIICGRWVRHAGWWPDRQLRLLRRGRARYDEATHVHEVAELDGPSGVLAEPLIHLNYETLAEFREKQRQFAHLEARTLAEQGRRARPRNLVLQPIREFRRRFLELGGYRQGLLGLQLSALMAEATFLTYRELLQIRSEPLDFEPASTDLPVRPPLC
jgi:(heptosyl)LPS beta-1,4-glucosyltransferase